ncbi:MAG: hypothetical protein KIT17_00725 [Rubrivivax sp.]|nr:hypothetical protein [Rubrivivax sp.]
MAYRHWNRIALALAEQGGARANAAQARANLADAALMAGDVDEAIEAGRQALAEAQALDLSELTGVTAANLCAAFLAAGRLEEARAAAAEAVQPVWRSGQGAYLSNHLALLGALCGHAAEAAQLLGYADAYCAAHHEGRQPNEAHLAEQAATAAATALGAAELARLRTTGKRLDDAAALALARRIAAPDGPPPAAPAMPLPSAMASAPSAPSAR